MYDMLQEQGTRAPVKVAELAKPRQRVKETKADRTGLPPQLKTGVENLSGYSMDRVRVHYHSSKPAQLHALAYAEGNDIYVASGQERHLPHEAWHVVQQMQGRVRPTGMVAGIPVNDMPSLEREADVMGEKAAQGKFVQSPVKRRLSVGNCVQAALPAGVNWGNLYQGIGGGEIIDDDSGRTVNDARALVGRLDGKGVKSYIRTLEDSKGLRRLANDIKLIKSYVKDPGNNPGFAGGNLGNLVAAQHSVNNLIESLESRKYRKKRNYIHREDDAHFGAMSTKARVMLDNVRGKSTPYLEKYFNPNGEHIRNQDVYYNVVRDKFKKIGDYLRHISYKNNYSEEGVYAYVYNNDQRQPAGTIIDGEDMGGTFAKSRMHGGVETGLQIRLGSEYRMAPERGSNSKPGVIIHEASHIILGTRDYAYGSDIFRLKPKESIKNADTYEYAAEES